MANIAPIHLRSGAEQRDLRREKERRCTEERTMSVEDKNVWNMSKHVRYEPQGDARISVTTRCF